MRTRSVIFSFFFFALLSLAARGQHNIALSVSNLQVDSIPSSIRSQLASLQNSLINSADSLKLPGEDSLTMRAALLTSRLQHRLDSLQQKGNPSLLLQGELDSLRRLTGNAEERYKKLLSLEQKYKGELLHHPSVDSVVAIGNTVKSKIDEINQVSNQLGLTSGESVTGKIDFGDNINASEINSNLPQTGVLNSSLPIDTKQLDTSMKVDIPNTTPDFDAHKIKDAISDRSVEVTEKIGDVGQTVGGVIEEADEYAAELRTIKDEGLRSAEKLPELAENEVMQLDQIKAFNQEQANAMKEVEQYKEILEQYKKEKAIEAELIEKSKELATDIIIQNNAVVNDAMKKIRKLKVKFSDVADMRNLPRHAPNPVKGLGWRERLVPGLVMQTFSTNVMWLEVDPQVYYRLNGRLSAGVGLCYRFGLEKQSLQVHQPNSLYGTKVFTNFHVFKGLFIRAEGQSVTWRSYPLYNTDPKIVDQTFVFGVGVGKRYQISKNVWGNAQTLYHINSGSRDPYKSKIMIRLGFDFSIKKRESKPWDQRWKELKKCK